MSAAKLLTTLKAVPSALPVVVSSVAVSSVAVSLVAESLVAVSSVAESLVAESLVAEHNRLRRCLWAKR